MNAVGNCEQPEIYKNIIFFESPVPEVLNSPPPVVPKPRVDYNIVFVHTPKQQVSPEPIVIAPPEKRTIVYVLTKNGQSQQQVIEVPASPGQAPEVFYVNYNEGDDHVLPGGMSLQEILAKGTDLDQSVVLDSGESQDEIVAPVEEYL
ncbi:UNVERIFIED_CONTAM: hypothetical protein GTU68_039356 [Idotea baltica]|nr:hypothetical protein [Idotea baltica]